MFTSDHGEHFGEDGYWFGHGPSTHEVAVKVPLLLRAPSIKGGRTDKSIVRLEDVMPTVLDLAGISRDEWPEMDGQSFAWRVDAAFETPREPVRAAFVEAGTPLRALSHNFLVAGRRGMRWCINTPRHSLCEIEGREFFYNHINDPELQHPLTKVPKGARAILNKAKRIWTLETARQRSVRESRFKLVAKPKIAGGFKHLLYDLQTDPAQRIDVSPQFPEEAARLEAALTRWAADLPPFDAEAAMSDEALEKLRSLGYVR